MRLVANTWQHGDTRSERMCVKLKRQHLLVAVCLSLLLVVPHAHAEVLDLEGTVKAVDVDARTVTIQRKTPSGTKTLTLEVAKKAGDISSIGNGDEVSITYDSDLELIASLAKKQTSIPTTDADLSPEEFTLVGDWKTKSGNEGKSFDATRVIREWKGDGNEFNRGVWLVRKDGTFLGAFRNKYSIEGTLTNPDTIEFTVFDPQHKMIERLRMNKVK
jgi:hypothetical protein